MRRRFLEETLPRDAEYGEGSQHGAVTDQLVDYRLIAQVENVDLYKKKLQGCFLEWHMPSGSFRDWHVPNVHIKELFESAQPGKGLEPSLHALCLTRIGRLTNNQDLILQGKRFYGTALRQLHYRLLSKELAAEDETLAMAQVFSIYEVSSY